MGRRTSVRRPFFYGTPTGIIADEAKAKSMSAQTTIDDRTAEIIRSALGAAQAGRLKEACEIGERGLAEGGDGPTLHAMIGAFLCGADEYQSAIPHLEAAHRARPSDPLIGRNLATALVGTEKYGEVAVV